jgi:hemolysin III
MVTRESPGVHAHRPIDELANLITHVFGLVLAIVASAFLMRLAIAFQPLQTVVAIGTYCMSLVALYAASTLSHSFHNLQWRVFFRTVDQACIYLLIVGSFTPIAITYLWSGWWPILLASMWILTILGVVLVLRMRNLTFIAKMTYGILGWLPIISLKTLFETAPGLLLVWMIAGGAFYSLGTVFLAYDHRVRYFHALWHTFVIAGSVCHYVAILRFVATV